MPAQEPNPYAPPQEEPEAQPRDPHEASGTITCTVVLETDDMRAGLATNSKMVRWWLTAWMALMGFLSGSSAPAVWQIGQTLSFGLLGWMFSSMGSWVNARRSLSNKSESERTVTYALSAASVEITTGLTYSRVQWPGVHRFAEGPKVFVLYLSEALLQIIPKRALRAADVDALRAMFTRYITPRKKRAELGPWVLVLWAVLIVMFLAIWQFLNSDVSPHPR